ncbi:MAG: hypothetical protein AAGG68_22585 [Bacteroidota bacterium]
MTLEHRKYKIIQQIILSKQEDFINAIDEVVKRFTKTEFQLDLSKHQNIEPFVDLDKIKSERPPVDFNMEEFIAEANELEWEQSIEELLADLD